VQAVAPTKPELPRFARQLRPTRLLSYAIEVAAAIQRTVATTAPTMEMRPEIVAITSFGLDHSPLEPLD
jgi:hypothetical protein